MNFLHAWFHSVITTGFSPRNCDHSPHFAEKRELGNGPKLTQLAYGSWSCGSQSEVQTGLPASVTLPGHCVWKPVSPFVKLSEWPLERHM
jgi:hypothetical protein